MRDELNWIIIGREQTKNLRIRNVEQADLEKERMT